MTARGLPFTAFVRDVLRVELTPAQRVLALAAFDGLEPRDLEGEDRELARRLFGDVDVVPPDARHVLVAVCGARAGKSYVLGALRLLHLALTVPLATLAPGEVAVALIVAPDLRLARQVLRYALGAAELVPSIRRCISSRTADGFTLQRPDGGTVSVECLPATRGGSAVRGRSLVGVVLDESAFFRDESFVVNDIEIFRAVAPRVLRGGQVIIASTPWTEAGLIFEFFSRNHGHPVDALSAHAPTLLLRDDEHTRSYVAREQARDPANAAREFGAEFMPSGADVFFDARAIQASVREEVVLPLAPRDETSVGIGADFGFRSDSSALVVVQRDLTDVFTVAEVIELRPAKDRPLVPSAVVAEFATVAKRHSEPTSGFASVMADGHYRESIAEHLQAHGLYLTSAPDGAVGKAETHQLARVLFHEGHVRMPNHPRLLRQLAEVVARPTAGGGISISSPRWRTGGHGDLVSALVLALFDAFKRPAPKPRLGMPAPGTVEAVNAEMRARKMAAMRDVRRRLERESRSASALLYRLSGYR